MQRRRLESGGCIDRNAPLFFSFNGHRLAGYRGDTLASALLANNISLLARSIKYHRPRGILSAGLEEPSALIACADDHGVFIPNLKATEVILHSGLIARSQNCWPTLEIDFAAMLQIGSTLLGAGFYYKTFMWPRKWWHGVYEKLIRRVAGQGKIACDADGKRYDKRFLNCDTLVIGSGPKGLDEALRAAAAGASVILIEQDQALGGSAMWEKSQIDDIPANQWLSHKISLLKQSRNVTCMVNTLAFGQYDHGLILALEQTRRVDPAPARLEAIYWRIRANNIVLATGRIEQPLVFPGNDRPGIMLAAAVRQYIYRYAVKPGTRACLAISDRAERKLTATALEYAGINIVASLNDGDSITATRGWHRLKRIDVTDSEGRCRKIYCDLMCVSAGWTASAHLAAQIGCKTEAVAQAVAKPLPAKASREQRHSGQVKAFVDFQNDVTRADLELAMREGYDHIELAKRYTTLGMGTDQGKTSWRNAIVELAHLSHKSTPEIGHTTCRPPYSPVSFGALVGADTGLDLVPLRQTPFHRVFESRRCVFQTSGDWLYSRYFPHDNESMQRAVRREVLAVRHAVGCVDMSTLGKVDVKGRDARLFLSRIYCNNIESMQPGRLRYGLMLREDGLLYDDGTVAQLAENHFLVSTTSANAAASWRWMNKMRQTQWPDLDVQLTSVSDQWASLALAGPQSRNLLLGLAPDFEIDKHSFPYAAVRTGKLNNEIPCRVFTVSYSGELSYEVNVPAGYASLLFERVLASGAQYDITPYGLEALDVLRIEKGHIAVGTEIDGRTTPGDLGLARMVSGNKDFMGASLLLRPALNRQDRPQLVGVSPLDHNQSIPPAAHLTDQRWRAGKRLSSLGKITAAVESPTLGYSIALALLQNGRQCYHDRLWAVSPVYHKSVEVEIGPHCFYDPDGSRLHE